MKFPSLGKIPTYHQDIWDISAIVNKKIGLFASHSITNFVFNGVCLGWGVCSASL